MIIGLRFVRHRRPLAIVREVVPFLVVARAGHPRHVRRDRLHRGEEVVADGTVVRVEVVRGIAALHEKTSGGILPAPCTSFARGFNTCSLRLSPMSHSAMSRRGSGWVRELLRVTARHELVALHFSSDASPT